jgi:RNA polymerase sigma-70 factor (ECF subfamily)
VAPNADLSQAQTEGHGGQVEPDDAPGVAAAQLGDVAAFNQLVLRHQDAVYTLCFRLTANADDAADATQEAFLAAFRHLAELRGGFRSWLLRIAANACHDVHRRRRRRPADSLSSTELDGYGALDVADPAPGPEAGALASELQSVLRAALLELPDEQRLALVLCDLYDFDYQAIAGIAKTELGTVKSRINRGRRRLRDILLAKRELLPAAYRLREEAQ